MKNRPLGPQTPTVIRLLTLLCFFHFSALNNGYTYMLEHCAPVRPSESVSQVGKLLGEWHLLLNPGRALSTMNEVSALVVRWTLSTGRAGARVFSLIGIPPSVKPSAAVAYGTQGAGPGAQIRAEKADYLLQEKEIWTKAEKRLAARPSAQSVLEWKSIRAAGAGQERMRARDRMRRAEAAPPRQRLQMASDEAEDDEPRSELAWLIPSSSDFDRRMIFFEERVRTIL